MKPMAQPDLHPDADVLNAFAEHALPEGERARVVAHMADCARCREVVFLARAAAEPEAAPTPVLKPEPRPGWLSAAFARWRVALIPAAALATVGATVLWVQLRPVMMSRQMAKMVPSSALPASQAATPAQSVEKKIAPIPQMQNRLVAPRAASAPVAKAMQGEGRPDLDAKKMPAPSSGLTAMNDFGSTASPAAPGGKGSVGAIHLDGRSAAMAPFARREIPPAAPPSLTFSVPQPGPARQTERAQQMPGSVGAQPPVTVSAAPAAVAAPPQSTLVEVAGDAPRAGSEFSLAAAQPPSEPVLAPQQLHGLALTRLSWVKLPNGLKTVSSAAVLNRMVAVDAAGGLFLSEDVGMHWVPVHAPWRGKAVEVQAGTQGVSHGFVQNMHAPNGRERELTAGSALQPAATNATADNTSKETTLPVNGASATAATDARAKQKPVPPALPPFFRLVTDHREVWVSVDGKLWRRQ